MLMLGPKAGICTPAIGDIIHKCPSNTLKSILEYWIRYGLKRIKMIIKGAVIGISLDIDEEF